jgi:hypothetical protein
MESNIKMLIHLNSIIIKENITKLLGDTNYTNFVFSN